MPFALTPAQRTLQAKARELARGSIAARAAEMVLSGDKPAICITEPGAGSAASGMITMTERTAGSVMRSSRRS